MILMYNREYNSNKTLIQLIFLRKTFYIKNHKGGCLTSGTEVCETQE